MAEVTKEEVLFEAVRHFVLSAGGDGDGWVISSRWHELATEFERYEASHERFFIDKTESDAHITFANSQESICFMADDSQLPSWAGDIIVYIY